MPDGVVVLLWVQAGSAFWLAFVLELVYRRVYRELFLRLWSLSFAAMGISMAAQLAVMPPSAPELFSSLSLYLLGTPQLPLVILAALSLRPPALSRRRQISILVGITAALILLSLATAWTIPDPLDMARAQRAERLLLNVAAASFFCIEFWRRHALAHTAGGRVTIFFTALRALHYAVLTATIAGSHLYPDPHSVISGAMSTILPFGIAAGMIILAAQAMTDTTRRLRDSEERYRTLVEASPDAIIATDPSGTIQTCNQRAADIHGYASAAELIGVSSEELITPADRQRIHLLQAPAIKAGRPVRLECRIVLRDGSMRWVELTTAVLRGSDGAITGNVTIMQDVSERKEAERALQREREFSAQVIDTIPGIFFVLDRQGRFARWNKNQQVMLDMPPERIRETPALVIIHPDDRRQVANMIAAVFDSGSAETEARGFQGDSIRHFYLTGRRLESEGVSYLVGCGVDITQRKEDQAARTQLESQLWQSQKIESIGRLAGGVAHDFNNHLTVIQGYSQLALKRMAATDPSRRALECVLQAGERAAKLTQQLLAFGRKQVLSPRAVSLNDIVSGMEAMLRRLVAENIEITTLLASGLGATMADVGQIEQVLMNLVVNARDAMPEGGKILIATTNTYVDNVPVERRQEIRPGPYVMLAVTDTGVGMDEQTRALAFEPFFTTKEMGKGTGLGLATVYGIVKQSGGSILVYSEPGKGTTFKVYLPRIDAEARPVSATAVSDGMQSGEGTILLVEDQEAVRALVAEVLQSCGYRVIVTGNGPQALDLSDSQVGPIDLLITDLVMPGTSGKELATQLTRRFEGLRVLFISGYTPNTIVHQGILDPGVSFLQKPFSPDQISAKVAEILSAR